MGIRQQIKSIIKENIKNRYLITPERYSDELHDLSIELFNLGKINEYEIDAEDLLDVLINIIWDRIFLIA